MRTPWPGTFIVLAAIGGLAFAMALQATGFAIGFGVIAFFGFALAMRGMDQR